MLPKAWAWDAWACIVVGSCCLGVIDCISGKIADHSSCGLVDKAPPS
jgi:hypothetical protein